MPCAAAARYTICMKRIYGKVLGIIAGAVLLRSNPLLGGLIGLLIGHALDADWFKQQHRPATRRAARDDPYAVLGVAADADDAAINLAYRRMMSQNHPDRMAQAAPELRRQAEIRTREINAAYDRIRILRKRHSSH